MDIPTSHPRYQSLMLRHRLIEGFKTGLATDSALLAHGRGEAFDYLLGEKTWDFAQEAIAVTSAMLIQAKRPVFSVNGNTASLADTEIIDLVKTLDKLILEVNLFYHTDGRSQKIAAHLKSLGAPHVFESAVNPAVILPGVDSARRKMNPQGISQADLVLVAIEDGDRANALVNAGYKVIAIDLNPMSRTAQTAHISIVDETTRVLKALTDQLKRDATVSEDILSSRIKNYDNKKILDRAITAIRSGSL